MIVIVYISREAEIDLADGYWFYESQEKELGAEFRESLKLEIRSLEINGGTHAKKYGLHRKVCAKFPFSIFYRLDSKSQLTVVAIFSQRRGKDWISKRLGK